MDALIRFADVCYFLAELVVYAVVAWWAFTREGPVAVRGLLGVGTIVVFAATWAVFAGGDPLRGAANVMFRVAWFGLGAAAGLDLLVGSWR